ncbi:MAG: ABC transporter ATP-binding protein [Planctomycetota bacterium]|nr:ABC transporter ATP-binding protein [Planctomycetota bacterium]
MTAEPSPNVVELRGVRRTYRMGSEIVNAIDGVDLVFRRGEYWSIMGPSGSGKSTMLNLLGCLDRPSEGTYLLGGEDTSLLDDDALSELRSRRLGFIFQSYNLIPQLDVLDNILVPVLYQSSPPADAEERARHLAGRVGLGDRISHRPRELSGGQMQRVAIARALVNDPDLILADEATGNLDSQTSIEILDLFDELHAEGKTLIFVTHEPHVAARAERILEMGDGKVQRITEQADFHGVRP